MGGRHADRLWMAAGFVTIVLMSVAAWFLLISPQYTEANDLQEQTDTSLSQATVLRKRIVALKKEKANLAELKAALKTYQEALPSDAGTSAFLRQLQQSGTDLGVEVGGMTVGSPAESKDSTGVLELPIQLTVTGKPAALGDFLEQLQGGGQKRAVLLNSATWTASMDADDPAKTSISLQLKAFVAPPVAADAPQVTTD
ncbi:type IV pilus inner membrane component PilO [Actinoplanes sp. RD1]|uniref:type 4a pilus biogenesis protein PilO n=1 Tax=Actinoplanes sp. RD1 TaxID=3064538 RepID=UPI002741DB5C|nr:type 4a pilus biogenesis protein PilO [Actinoplanes sp. RD1]